jgi:hypothetical protein
MDVDDLLKEAQAHGPGTGFFVLVAGVLGIFIVAMRVFS